MELIQEGEILIWDYASADGRWRKEIPLRNISPYPVRTQGATGRRYYQVYGVLGIIIGVAAIAANAGAQSFGYVSFLAGVMCIVYSFLYRELVWSMWKTLDHNEDFYFFASQDIAEFDRAIEELKRRVLEVQGEGNA